MAEETALLDTVVLVSAVDVARSDHADCLALLERHRRLRLCAQTCREFLAVSTRPQAANGLGQTPAQALDNLARLRLRIPLLPEEKPLLPALLKLVEAYRLVGRGIHDAGLVAAAQVHRASALITSDGQVFARYAGILAVQSPAEALAGM